MRGALARRVVERGVGRFPVRLRYPDGHEVGGGAPGSSTVELVRPRELYRRLGEHPKIGLGEAYMAGDWRVADGSDLAVFLRPFAERVTAIVPSWMLRLRALVDRAIPHHQRNTPEGSRRNIEAHYDLSNELFIRFLDDTLSYSSAIFHPERALLEQTLEEAQARKIETALDAAGVGEGTRLLEIGTGWGSLAIAAAERGAQVTTITLSGEQRALALERIEAAGLSDLIDVRLEDYREVEGEYDAVVSIEMIEAVGEEFWATYFETIDARLRPGGRAVVQAILMDHDRYLATRNSFGWIQKYIFPGGMIPTIPAIEQATGATTTLSLTATNAFGRSYAETLRRWRERFLANWPAIAEHGFDGRFRRMWEFYLAYCEAGFAAGYLEVAQLTFVKAPAVSSSGRERSLVHQR